MAKITPVRSTRCVDPGWQHGIAQDNRKKKVKCNYCGKIVSGGIFRLKQHLARISGEVTHCEKAPEQVCLNMRKNLEGCRFSRKRGLCEYDPETSTSHSNVYDDSTEARIAYKLTDKKVGGDANMIIRSPHLRSLGYVVDLGWEHCIPQDQKKKKVKCNYCNKVISGGINRFKQHLAKIPGEVAYCDRVPDDVYLKIKEHMKWHRSGRQHLRSDGKEISQFYTSPENEVEEDEGILHCISRDIVRYDEKAFECHNNSTDKGKIAGSSAMGSEPPMRRSRLDSVFLNSLKVATTSPPEKMKRGCEPDKRSHKEVISAICEFFYHAGVPPSAADSPYFKRMLQLVGQYGEGLKAPSSESISGQFLHDGISSIRGNLVDLRASWTVTGCSIMADCWKDFQGRVLINLLVSSPRGIHFLSSVDATDIVEDHERMSALLESAVDEIGEENVVQIITKETASFRAAGKRLEGRRKHLFWTPCAIDCIDKMLEDFIKVKWIGECFGKAKKITRFLHKTMWLLNLVKREIMGGRELLVPGLTKFSTSLLTLQNLCAQRNGLEGIFQSTEWRFSKISQSKEGKEVEKLVLNAAFWKKADYVNKSLEPVMQVHQKIQHVDSQSISSVYNDMHRAKLVIMATHGHDVRRFEPLLNMIDTHWRSLFLHPLHVAAYFLNPSLQYRHDSAAHPEVIGSLDECIARMGLDETQRISASVQIPEYVSAKGDFGTNLAVRTRTELDPAAWWLQHGSSCPELQRIAVRVLSQTCSSVGCEHTWSVYDQVRCMKHNILSWKRWSDLSYAHYNLRLRESKTGGCTDRLVATFDGAASGALLDDWVESVPQERERENEVASCHDNKQFYIDGKEDYFNDDADDEMDGGEETAATGTVVGPSEGSSPGGAGNVTTEKEEDHDHDHDHDEDDLHLLDDDLSN